MYALVLALVLAVVLYLIGRPLVQPDPDEEALLLEVSSADMERERVFGALTEVEADYQMHKLSEADYQELKREYARQAVEVLKSMPAVEPGVVTRAGRPASPTRGRSPSPARGHAAGVPQGRPTQADLKALEAEAEAEVALALELAGEGGGAGGGAVPGGTAAPGDGAAAVAYCPHCVAQLLSADQKFCHACGKMQRGEA